MNIRKGNKYLAFGEGRLGSTRPVYLVPDMSEGRADMYYAAVRNENGLTEYTEQRALQECHYKVIKRGELEQLPFDVQEWVKQHHFQWCLCVKQ